MSLIINARSWAPNIELPATKQFAPLSAAIFAVYIFIPPSTWISISGNLYLHYLTLFIIPDINDWPPNPGSTVIIKNLSINPFSANETNYSSIWVYGLTLTPTAISYSFILLHNCYVFPFRAS